ncbi:hypothetical protein C8N25_1235 [Algoriphagus antarcticus]|jgi:hypothetical protein|uniref:Uncharacterized protein n=1 Tax=Algoriphagus antarcticus TaxID=238540 RepID=A0A3E0DIX7_9BACT|nr:hypothetical protein C8N25_1235 [Algoriphagus antarcticus]
MPMTFLTLFLIDRSKVFLLSNMVLIILKIKIHFKVKFYTFDIPFIWILNSSK